MRLAIYDNLANNAYLQAKVFRRQGHPVDLILDPRDRFVMSDPRWEDVDLELPADRLDASALPDLDMPDWIHREPPLPIPGTPRRYAVQLARTARVAAPVARAGQVAGTEGALLAVDRSWVVHVLRRYECVIAYGMGPVFAALAAVPCLAQTWGGDITQIPFIDGEEWEGAGEEPILGRPSVRRAHAQLQRWGYRRAHRLLLTDPRFLPFAERLGQGSKSVFLPFIMDTDKYAPGDEPELRRRFLPDAGGRLVFVPSRQDWYWKGSDRMLAGFARAANGRPDVVLVCAGWGRDRERSLAFARSLGIADRVVFLPYALSKTRLLRYYRAADVVMDQFNVGSYGSSALEAMSCARPLLIHLDRDRFSRVFDELPSVANTHSPEEIGVTLGRLLDDTAERRALGEAARRWVLKNQGPGLVEPTLDLCRSAAAGR